MPATPKQAADQVMARAWGLIRLEDPPASVTGAEAQDLRSLALAMGLAALDTYMHWTVRSVDLYKPLPRKLRNLSVSFGALIDSANASIDARRNGVEDRPRVRARNVLNDELLRDTFHTVSGIETALALLGVSNYWSPVAAQMPAGATVADVKQRLGRLAHERNKVVHEGDLKRFVRPQRVQREVRVRSDIENDLRWIESLIAAFDAIL